MSPLQFNGKPYPAADVASTHKYCTSLAELTALGDDDCAQLVTALRTVLRDVAAEKSPYSALGVCHAVSRNLDKSHYFDTYLVLNALGLAWSPALTIRGHLACYFCNAMPADADLASGCWEGVNLERRVQFMQFCVEALEEFVQDRSRTTSIYP